MPQDRTRKIVITGVLGYSSTFGFNRLGFIPWISGASLTIMHILQSLAPSSKAR